MSQTSPVSARLTERLSDVIMMLEAPDAYNREYIAAVCRSIRDGLAQTPTDELVDRIHKAVYEANGSTLNCDVRHAIRAALADTSTPAPAQGQQDPSRDELIESIQYAIGMLSMHINAYHDFDYAAHQVPPELEELRRLQHHLEGSLINSKGETVSHSSTVCPVKSQKWNPHQPCPKCGSLGPWFENPLIGACVSDSSPVENSK